MLDFICNGFVDLFGTGRERKVQNENIFLQRDSNPHPASPRQESCSALDRSATLVRYQVEHYSLTVFWNGYVTIPVWNRLWFRIPLETYIFILNFSLPPRSEQVNRAVAIEIKHVHSPEVIVVLDPRYDLSYKALYISTCSIALNYIVWWKYPLTRGKTVFVRCFLFQQSVMTNPTIFWTLLRSNAHEFVQDFVLFLSGKK